MILAKQTDYDRVNEPCRRARVQSEHTLFGLDFQPTMYDKLRQQEWIKGDAEGIEVLDNLWDSPDNDTDMIE